MISIVIPAFNDSTFFIEVISALEKQTYSDMEIIVVDSSTVKSSSEIIQKKLKNCSLASTYRKIERSYAGKSNNVGLTLVRGDLIGFLDTKTIPDTDWLERYLAQIKNGYSVVFGVTRYIANTPFQNTLKAASYGEIGHQTVPGTVVIKEVIDKTDGFLENTRAAYDQEWKERIMKQFSFIIPSESSITYEKLPNSIIEIIKKYLLYSFHAARIEVQTNLKQFYLSLMLVFSGVIASRWNFFWSGWDESSMFISHITKIYIFSMIFLLLVLMFINRLFNVEGPRLLLNSLKLMAFILISYSVYNWNAAIANWVESAFLYIPHITKIYILSLLVLSITYRGIYMPLNRNVSKSYLFPVQWIAVGFLGLLLDLAKAPGFLLGAFVSIFRFTK
tara:strand:- start:203 stop:1372 length:1170 start_codon:yes stop_codon:yes gene_type:complete